MKAGSILPPALRSEGAETGGVKVKGLPGLQNDEFKAHLGNLVNLSQNENKKPTVWLSGRALTYYVRRREISGCPFSYPMSSPVVS